MRNLIQSVGAFVPVIGILVFVHEMGHYLAARWRGVYVEAFSIGFGRALVAWTDRVGTQWKVGWLPLGGYVKLHGQEQPDSVSDEVRSAWQPGRTFYDKSVGSRAIVVVAGPVANFLLAIALFSALFATVGRPVPAAVVGEVIDGSAAASAGLHAGDTITAIGNEAVHRFEDIQRIVTAHPGDTEPFALRRDGQVLTVPVHLGSRDAGNGIPVGVLGIHAGSQADYQRLTLGPALVGGFSQTWDVTAETLRGLWQMITGHRGTDELSGPLGIAKLSGQAAQLGFGTLVWLIAVLSINLGLINLFPVPILDGGHLMFLGAEALRGRPLPIRAQEYGFRVGLLLLSCLIVFATWNDLRRLLPVQWIVRHIT